MKTIDLMSVSHYLAMLQKTELSKARTHIKELYLQNILEDKFLINPELDNNPYLKAYVQGTLGELLEGLQGPPGFEDASIFLRRPKRAQHKPLHARLQVIKEASEPLVPNTPRLAKQQTAGSAGTLGLSKASRLKSREVRLIQDAIIKRRKKDADKPSPPARVKFASHTTSRKNLLPGISRSPESRGKPGPGHPIEDRPDSPSTAGLQRSESRRQEFQFVVVKGSESPRRSSLYAGKTPVLVHQDSFELPTFVPPKQALLSPEPTEANLHAASRELASVEGLKSEDFEADSRRPEAEPGKTGSNPSQLKTKSGSKQLLDPHSRYYLEKEVAKEEVEIEMRQLQRRHSTRVPNFNFHPSKELGSVSLIPFSRHPSFDHSKLHDQASLEYHKEASLKPLALLEANRRSYSIEEPRQPQETHTKASLTRANSKPCQSIRDPSEQHSKHFAQTSTGFASHKHKTKMRETFDFTTGSAGPGPRHKPEATISNFTKPSPSAVQSHRDTRSIGDVLTQKYGFGDPNPYEDYLPEASSGTSTRKPYSDLMAMRGKVTGFLRAIEYSTSINSNPNHLRKVHKLLQI